MLGKSTHSKRVFKEKIVQLYISIIKGEEPTNDNHNFWDEFFLLKANGNALELELKKIEKTTELKTVANLLFGKCLEAIHDTSQLRVLNGLITLCSLSHHVLHSLQPVNGLEESIDTLIGNDNLNEKLEDFVVCVCDILFNEIPLGIKDIVVRLLLILASAERTIDGNLLIYHLMSDQLFDALIHLLNIKETTQREGSCRILLLLAIFLNFKKSVNNPYVMKLSIVDNDATLNGYSLVITSQLVEFNTKFERIYVDSRSGILSTLTNMVGTIFTSDDGNVDINAVMGKKSSFHDINTCLLAFYEAVLLNRNFISLLTTSPPEMISKDNITNTDDCNLVCSSSNSSSLPPNLLVAFLEFSSIVMLDMKDEAALQTTRLCFIIMTCITEDSCANSIIHDNNMAFMVNLHKMPMRHRKVSSAKTKGVRPISHAILDLLVEFIMTHMNRHLQVNLFHYCLDIIHRLLCFQKRCRVRVEYSWNELWSALTSLVSFLVQNENHFAKQPQQLDSVFSLSQQILTIFNLFITCGDNFLSAINYYDELYYELIRTHDVFDKLNSLALRHMTKEEYGFKESATKVTNSLINIKAIRAHFKTKIEDYSGKNQIVSLSEEQVLEVVRANYDSLTLKVQDCVDQFEPYDPTKSDEFDFFMKLLLAIVDNYVTNKPLTITLEEQHLLVQEIQLTASSLNVNLNTEANSSSNNGGGSRVESSSLSSSCATATTTTPTVSGTFGEST